MRSASRPVSVAALALSLLGLGALSIAGAAPASAGTTYSVDSTLDEPDANPGDGRCSSTPSGHCTLRAAVEEGQLAGATVRLGKATYPLQLGHLWVKDGGVVTIEGRGSAKSTIDGQYQWRILDISPQGRAAVTGVTLTGGAGGRSDAYPGHDHGGAIHNHGFLYLAESAVWSNTAGKAVGQRSGAGLTNAGGATAELRNVTFSDNFIFMADSSGGAIENRGTLQAHHITVANNAATSGGGIFISAGAKTYLDGALLAVNSGYSCAGVVTPGLGLNPAATIADSFSLDDDASCRLDGADSRSGVDPGLGDFDPADKVWTLQPNSVAVDGVKANFVSVDQTGRARPIDGNGDGIAYCDIGAWEYKTSRR